MKQIKKPKKKIKPEKLPELPVWAGFGSDYGDEIPTK